MFTGLVEAAVPVAAVERRGEGARLLRPRPADDFDAAVGDSICVSGCCLTVAAIEAQGALAFDLSAETLARTWFDGLEPGMPVNLERSVRLMDRLGGHLVSGHVDGGGAVAAIEDSDDGGQLIGFEVDAGLERYLIEKGSIALDGVSLTVVEPRGRRFDVAVIPATLELTSLGSTQIGRRVNVEVDMIGKWVEKLVTGG